MDLAVPMRTLHRLAHRASCPEDVLSGLRSALHKAGLPDEFFAAFRVPGTRRFRTWISPGAGFRVDHQARDLCQRMASRFWEQANPRPSNGWRDRNSAFPSLPLCDGEHPNVLFVLDPDALAAGRHPRILEASRVLMEEAGLLLEHLHVTAEREHLSATLKQVEHLGDCTLVLWDPSTRSWTWSPEAARLLGQDPAAHRPPTLPELARQVHPSDLPELRRGLRQWRRQAAPLDQIFRVFRAGTGWHSLRLRGAQNAGNLLLQAVFPAVDEETFPRALPGDPNAHPAEASWALDPSGQWVLHPAPDPEPAPEGPPDLGPEALVLLEARLESYRNGVIHGTDSFVVEHHNAQGRALWMEIQLTPVTDADGRFLGLQGQNRNITDRRIAESALRESERQYRRLVEENLALLARSRQEAEIKSILLQEVNHRVKNNLTGILGMLDMEIQALPGHHSPVLAALEDLKQRIFALASVHDLLSAAEWSTIRLEALADVIVRNTLAASPWGRGIQVDFHFEEEDIGITPKVATSLAMILAELATNSVKYAFAHRGSGRLSLRVLPACDAWHRIALEFEDDGPGFPEEVLQGQRENVGLKLIRLNVRNLIRGALTLENAPGARVRLLFQPAPLHQPGMRP